LDVIRDQYNVIPVTMAVFVHAAVVGSLLFAFDFTDRSFPVVPLAIQATLVSEGDTRPLPEPVEQPEPTPIETPPPDTSAADRARKEETKRQMDLQAEQDRIRLQQEKDQQRRDQEKRERKARAEAEADKQRALAEKRRLADLERQRLDNERKRQEAEAAVRQRQQQAEIEAEENRRVAEAANDIQRWQFAIQQKITQNFILPASAPASGLECVVRVRQLPGGRVVDVNVGRCNGDDAVRRAIEAAVHKASPLPSPDNSNIFERDLQIVFKPTQ
jgi:colicin import membrane protein